MPSLRRSAKRSGPGSTPRTIPWSARPRIWNELQEKSRKDWKEYREHLASARGHWREALRMLARVPEEA